MAEHFNPYAGPLCEEDSLWLADHVDYRVVDSGIVFRDGAVLPKVCIRTGCTEGLKENKIDIYVVPRSGTPWYVLPAYIGGVFVSIPMLWLLRSCLRLAIPEWPYDICALVGYFVTVGVIVRDFRKRGRQICFTCYQRADFEE